VKSTDAYIFYSSLTVMGHRS